MSNNATSPYSRKLPTDYSAYSAESQGMIPVGSSLSVMGALLVLARDRFQGPPDDTIPYVWVKDVTLPDTEFQEDPQKSNISIEIATNTEKDEKDKRPVILVDRGPIQTNKLVMDDRVDKRREQGLETKHTLVQGSFRYICRAQNRGSAEVIANILFETLLYGIDVYRKHFQFHELGPFTLGAERLIQKDTDIYECPVDFRLAWDHRWSNKPIAPRMSHISIDIYASSVVNSASDIQPTEDNRLTRIALSSLSRN